MKRTLLPLALLGATGVAMAATWSDFLASFPGLPCNDGWAGCVVDNTIVTPGMVVDAGNRPHPADMRYGFFEFDALPGLSPFVGLSEYTESAAVADAGAEKRRPKRQSAASSGTVSTTERSAPAPAPDRVEARAPAPAPTPAAAPPTPESDDDYGSEAATRPNTRPSAANTRTASVPDEAPPPDEVRTVTRPEPTVVAPVERPPPEVRTVTPAPPPEPTVVTRAPPPEPTVVAAAPPAPPPEPKVVTPVGCDNIVSLEAPAMMGQLGVGRRKCIEGKIGGSSQTTKNKLSRLLLSDAEARGDRADWERLMKRHLEDIDRSDPNLCFKYAIHLSRGGVGRAHGVIRWADYALENKQQWSGTTYKKNVNGLYKLRAQAANRLWQSAEKKFVTDRSDANEAKSVKYRGMSKDYAREWLDYARASGQSTKTPLALCVSAAGNKEFCEG